jgi:hypothetical protein
VIQRHKHASIAQESSRCLLLATLASYSLTRLLVVGGLLGLALLPALGVEESTVRASPGELLRSVLHVRKHIGGGLVVSTGGDDANVDHGEDGGESEHT